jgi:choice-of-anchor B domain-containing protein
MNRVMKFKLAEWEACAAAGECPKQVQDIRAEVKCVNGYAGVYPCSNMDLLSFVSSRSLGSTGNGNDIWGWTDPTNQKEYAIVGTVSGTSFVDITVPTNPGVLCFLHTHTVSSSWRDIKVYNNHAFVVSEAANHGMQIFDLTKLRTLQPVAPGAPVPACTADVVYSQFGSAHNLVINEDTGFAYSVGSKTCSAGLHVVNIRDPRNPRFVGCFGDDGYVHDAQCVTYEGPDTSFTGREICYCYNEDSLTIVDVTDKTNMEMIAREVYVGNQYCHQGWTLGPKSPYLLLDDELDELYNSNHHTRTMVWDATDLKKPKLIKSFYAAEEVIDHNLYTKGDRAYLSNYCGGLRVLDTSKIASGGDLSEVAYFDVAPDCDTTQFLGSWSSYIDFPSGNIVVNSIDRGLFVVKHQ